MVQEYQKPGGHYRPRKARRQKKPKRTEHYYTRKPKSKPRKIIIKTKILGRHFKFYSSSSIFSKSKIDSASLLMITRAQVRGDVLDLGCGYGVIGIALKIFHPEISLHMSDVNSRAARLARKNKGINNVSAQVRQGEGLGPWKKKQFDVILLNPPIAAGLQECFNLIKESHAHLKQGGLLQVVAHHNKGGRLLKEKMLEIFNNVCDVTKKGGVRIYASQKTKEEAAR